MTKGIAIAAAKFGNTPMANCSNSPAGLIFVRAHCPEVSRASAPIATRPYAAESFIVARLAEHRCYGNLVYVRPRQSHPNGILCVLRQLEFDLRCHPNGSHPSAALVEIVARHDRVDMLTVPAKPMLVRKVSGATTIRRPLPAQRGTRPRARIVFRQGKDRIAPVPPKRPKHAQESVRSLT